jgi:hypothetical protein
MTRPRFFTGAYGKFWTALLAGAGAASGVLVLALVSQRWPSIPGPEPLVIRDAVLTLWGALVAALGAALGANIEPGSTIVAPPVPANVTTTVAAPQAETGADEMPLPRE